MRKLDIKGTYYTQVMHDGELVEFVPPWAAGFDRDKPYKSAIADERYTGPLPSAKSVAYMRSLNAELASMIVAREARRGKLSERKRDTREAELREKFDKRDKRTLKHRF